MLMHSVSICKKIGVQVSFKKVFIPLGLKRKEKNQRGKKKEDKRMFLRIITYKQLIIKTG